MGSIKSYTNRHGRTVHYDEAGNKVGESHRSPSGGRVIHYDASGRESGRSYGSPSGRMTHYDGDGNRTGTSYTAWPGRIRHYDAQGQKTGDTVPTFWGTTTSRKEELPTGGPSPMPAQAGQRTGRALSSGCAVVLLVFAAIGLIGLISAIAGIG